MSAAVITPTTATGFKPDRSTLIALGWRLAVVVAAALAVLLGLPAWGRAPLTIAAALITGDCFVRRYRRRGLLDAVLTAIGGGIVVLALLGLLLNVLPWGLTAGSWAVAVGLVEAALLVVLGLRRAPVVAPIRPTAAAVPAVLWTVLVVAVLTAAVAWSANSFTGTHVAPLAVAAHPSNGEIVVSVTSGTDQGPFDLDLVTADRRTVLKGGIRVGPGTPATTTVRLPAGTRGLVQLVTAGSTTAVRQLTLDSTSTSASTATATP